MESRGAGEKFGRETGVVYLPEPEFEIKNEKVKR